MQKSHNYYEQHKKDELHFEKQLPNCLRVKKVEMSEIAKTCWSTLISYRSDTLSSDQHLIDIDTKGLQWPLSGVAIVQGSN